MIHLHDITSHALPTGLNVSPGLRAILADRLARLDTALLPWTDIVAVQPSDREHDVVSALGYSPLVDPWDGHRWPDPRFQPGWDFIGAYPTAFQLNFSFGSTFGQILLVEQTEGVLPELLALCRHYTAPTHPRL